MNTIQYTIRHEVTGKPTFAFGLDASVAEARRRSHGTPVNIFRGRDLVAFTQTGDDLGVGFVAAADERAALAMM